MFWLLARSRLSMIAPVVIDVAPAVVSDGSQQGVVQQLISRRAPCPLTLTIAGSRAVRRGRHWRAPDDLEIVIGRTLATLTARGRRVLIVGFGGATERLALLSGTTLQTYLRFCIPA